MRLHYLANSFLISNQANAVHVMRMCRAFSGLGHDVTLSALMGNGNDHDVFDYYGTERSFRLIRYDESEYAPTAALLALRRKIPGMRVGPVPSILFGRAKIAPALRREQPDLVYGRNLNWLLGLGANIPFIAESHRPPRNRVEHALETRLFRKPGFRRLVVISAKLRELYMEQFPWLAEHILVAHDAADDPFQEAPASVGEKERGFHVGYIGHLYAGRGGSLIKALARRLPQVTFHLVGGTEGDRAGFIAAGCPENIILHGHHPPSQLAGFYARFDAVLAPYQRRVSVGDERSDTSAFMSPLKIFEYMAWGKPILCSDLPVLHEVLEDGRNAILLSPDNVALWVEALQRLEADAALRNRIGQAARADFLNCYSWERRAHTVLSDIEFTS